MLRMESIAGSANPQKISLYPGYDTFFVFASYWDVGYDFNVDLTSIEAGGGGNANREVDGHLGFVEGDGTAKQQRRSDRGRRRRGPQPLLQMNTMAWQYRGRISGMPSPADALSAGPVVLDDDGAGVLAHGLSRAQVQHIRFKLYPLKTQHLKSIV